jgi:flavin-dependent dehydrogenase
VLVAGAGPAGAAAALGLARMGYSVCVVGTARPFEACEGISRRVIEGLRHQGFRQALEMIPAPVMREVDWNGERRAQNTEHLLWRPGFDAALRDDLKDAGVLFRSEQVAAVLPDHARPGLRLADGAVLHARIIVEARGRAAPQGRAGATHPQQLHRARRPLIRVRRLRRSSVETWPQRAPSTCRRLTMQRVAWANSSLTVYSRSVARGSTDVGHPVRSHSRSPMKAEA